MIEVGYYLGVDSASFNFSITRYFITTALLILLTILMFANTHFTRVAKYFNRFPGPPIVPLLGNAGLFMGDPAGLNLIGL